MGTRAAFTMACCTGALLVASAAVSCGARTGLFSEPDEPFGGGLDGGLGSPDQFIPDQSVADGFFPDVFAFPDVMKKDVSDDLPGIEAARPDAPVFNPCPDAAATLIYVIGQSGTLYSYDPPTATFTTIGVVSCPGAEGTTPFSMAVDREGIAYVEFFSEPARVPIGADLYRVSTKTAACTATPYNPAANGRVTYGMGFVANVGDASDAGETLFIAEQPLLPDGGPADDILATVDTTTFAVSPIGAFSPQAALAELTGTGDGRLFAFFNQGTFQAQTSILGQIDPATAQVVAQDVLALPQGNGWAFGFWGGDFYMFTAPFTTNNTPPHTIVTRFNLTDRSLIQEAALPNDVIVGAGVSTCAPSQ